MWVDLLIALVFSAVMFFRYMSVDLRVAISALPATSPSSPALKKGLSINQIP